MKRYILTFGAADTTKSVTLSDVPAKVLTLEIKINIANFTNSVTATLEIDDADGHARFSLSGLAKGTQSYSYANRVVSNGYTYKVTLSGAPGGSGGDVTIDTEVVEL